MKWVALIPSVAVFVAACAVSPIEAERAVYAAALPVPTDADHRLPTVVVRERTITVPEMGMGRMDVRALLKRRLPTAPSSLIDQFVENAASSSPVTPSALTGISYAIRIASDMELSQVFSGASLTEGWRKFREDYPNASGLVRLSRVAFEGDLALVYVDVTCGPLCGSGKVVLLQRRDGEWRVVQNAGLWIS